MLPYTIYMYIIFKGKIEYDFPEMHKSQGFVNGIKKCLAFGVILMVPAIPVAINMIVGIEG